MIKTKATSFLNCKFPLWEDDKYDCRSGFLKPGYRVSIFEPNQQIQSQAAMPCLREDVTNAIWPCVFSRISSCPFSRSIAQIGELQNQKLKIKMFWFTFVNRNITKHKKNCFCWPSYSCGMVRCVCPCVEVVAEEGWCGMCHTQCICSTGPVS